MKNIIFIIALLIIGLSLKSCEKDIMKTTPESTEERVLESKDATVRQNYSAKGLSLKEKVKASSEYRAYVEAWQDWIEVKENRTKEQVRTYRDLSVEKRTAFIQQNKERELAITLAELEQINLLNLPILDKFPAITKDNVHNIFADLDENIQGSDFLSRKNIGHYSSINNDDPCALERARCSRNQGNCITTATVNQTFIFLECIDFNSEEGQQTEVDNDKEEYVREMCHTYSDNIYTQEVGECNDEFYSCLANMICKNN